MSNQKKIILFDGVCNFCNFWVDFVIKRDKEDVFKFAALQSASGKALLEKYNFSSSRMDTLVLILNDQVYTRSTAALIICRNLSGPMKLSYPLIFVPSFIRDFIYNLIAKNRYKFFGKKESCRVPTEEERNKFV